MKNINYKHPALSLFEELLAIPSPSGREERSAEFIRRRLESWGYEPEVDHTHTVLVRFPGRNPDGPLTILAAHTDEIGLVVTGINDDGSLSVDRSGGLYPWKIGERPVEIIGDSQSLTGVISFGSTHTGAAAERVIKWPNVRVLTGLSPDQLRTAGIRPGATAVPTRDGCGPVIFGDPADPLVGAWTFDDRMGVVALLRLLEEMSQAAIMPHLPTIIAFTTHEEGGGNGAKSLCFRERPTNFIAVDGCPTPPGSGLSLDGRPGIWSKDRFGHYDQRLVRDLCRAAEQAGTSLQPVVYETAASDASLVRSVGSADRIACFGHVRENSHGYEVARLACFDQVYDILLEFIRNWAG